MELVSPIVDLVLDKGYNLAEKEFLKFYNAKEDVKKLNETLTAIKAVLLDAENKQADNEGLRHWLRRIIDAAYDADDVLDSWATRIQTWEKKSNKVHKTFLPLKKLGFYYSVGDDVSKIRSKLDTIAQDRFQFDLKEIRYDTDRSGIVWRDRPEPTGSFVREVDVVGRKNEAESLVKLLVENRGSDSGGVEICYVAIIGLPGLGKTTLAQLAYNDKRVEDTFSTRMWVCVSDSNHLSLAEVKRKIIESHNKMKEDSDSTILLDNKLFKILSGKQYLLVLDDVWTYEYNRWKPLLDMLRLGAPGSKVLITSRNKKVWEKLGTRAIDPFTLPYLGEEDCWLMFKTIAFEEGETITKELEESGKEILKKCDGLPLAVGQMAGLLRGTMDVGEWDRIRTSEMWELRGPVLPALRLSFNYLPSELKQCFSYCSLFPKSYEYRKEELIKLWIGESFIRPSNNEKIEDKGKRYFSQLTMRSFFQPSNANRYRMHDLVHDLACSVSRPYCCQVKDNNSCYIIESSRHVSLLCNDVEKPVLNMVSKSKKLRTFLMPVPGLKNVEKSLDKMLKTFKYMRALDLSNSMILALPKSIEGMPLLRFLDLSNTEIRELPNSICRLNHLQTLKLLGCPWIFSLPGDLGDLVNLRHLELDDIFWYKTSKLPPRLGTITSLHNLHSFRIGCQKGYGVEEMKDMKYLSGTLRILNLENAVSNAGEAALKDKKSLERVVLQWSDRETDPRQQEVDEKALEDLQPHSNVKELSISNYKGKKLPLWLRTNLLPNLVSVELRHCSICKTLILGQLSHLKKLKLKGMLELKEWNEETEMEFISLIELKISNCPNLNKIPACFLNLYCMKIKKACSLKALPLAPSLRFLSLIDNLVLENWNETQLTLFLQNDQDQQETQNLHSYSNLLELKITNCPRMQQLPLVFAPQKLEISGCKLVKCLPVPHYSQRLQHLGLDSCEDNMLVTSIPSSNSMYSLFISNISTLATFPKWPALPLLRALYIRDCADLSSLSEPNDETWCGLKSLEMLSIRGCPKLVKLPIRGLPSSIKCLSIRSCPSFESFGSAEILTSLTSLSDVYLEDCPALQGLPECGLPNSVVHLQIKGCPLLLERCRSNGCGGPDWSKIKDIPDKDIEMEPPTVQSSSSSSSVASKSRAWYQQVRSCREINIREVEQPMQRESSSNDTMRRDQERNRKGKMVAGPSTSA